MTTIAQELPEDLESIISRQLSGLPIRTYELNGNMDETPVYMDMVPSKTPYVRLTAVLSRIGTSSNDNYPACDLVILQFLAHCKATPSSNYDQIDARPHPITDQLI